MRITSYPQQYVNNNRKVTKANNNFADTFKNATVQNNTAKAPGMTTTLSNEAQTQQSPDLDAILLKAQSDNAIRQAINSSANITPKSIYDLSRSELESRYQQALKISSEIDTNGLSKAEIYNRVESIFSEYLGKDFLEPNIIYGNISALQNAQNVFPYGTYMNIHNNFYNVLYNHGVNVPAEPDAVIEAKGYDGMTKSEIYTAVRAKYPNSMTLKECFLMSYELGKLGVENTSYEMAVVENIMTTLAISSGTNGDSAAFAMQAKKVLDAMLDKPADYDIMKASVETYRTAQGNLYFTYDIGTIGDNLIDVLLSWFGGGGLYNTDMIDELMGMLEGLQNNKDT